MGALLKNYLLIKHIDKELPLIEGRDRQQIFQRDAAEIPRWSEAETSSRRAYPLVAPESRVRAVARYIRGKKIGRLSGDRGAVQNRQMCGRRVVLRQEGVDILRVDHQDGGVLDVRLPRDVQLDQDAARYLVEQRQTKHRGWTERNQILFRRRSYPRLQSARREIWQNCEIDREHVKYRSFPSLVTKKKKKNK